MRIRKAPKHTDPTDTDTDVDPDPQHWLGQIFDMADINDRPRTSHAGGKYRPISQFPRTDMTKFSFAVGVQIQKEVMSVLKCENQFLSKEIWEST
jgi:hypothetical protein